MRRALVHLIDNEERFRSLPLVTPRHGPDRTRQAVHVLLDSLADDADAGPTAAFP